MNLKTGGENPGYSFHSIIKTKTGDNEDNSIPNIHTIFTKNETTNYFNLGFKLVLLTLRIQTLADEAVVSFCVSRKASSSKYLVNPIYNTEPHGHDD